MPSSKSTSTWVIAPTGCEPSPFTAQNCPQSRGGVFESANSSSWRAVGNYSLVDEDNLGDYVNGTFGLDTISLGAANASGAPTLANQVVGQVGSNDFYDGLFGLNDQPSNFSTLNNTHPSFLATMKTQGIIPSLSWSYTAGASYRKCKYWWRSTHPRADIVDDRKFSRKSYLWRIRSFTI